MPLAVAPLFRRRSIARSLQRELQREAAARGVPRIELEVWAFNDQAQQLFTTLGFRPVMERMTLAAE